MYSHSTLCSFCFMMLRPPPPSSPLPYTTLFRSVIGLVNGSFPCPEQGALLRQTRRMHLQGTVNILDRCDHFLTAPWRCMRDRKSTRLNSSHLGISYAVFCLKKKMTLNRVDVLLVNVLTLNTV